MLHTSYEMNWEILYKYMHDDCSEEELKVLREWLDDEVNEEFFCTFIESWETDQPEGLESDAQEAWQKFRLREFYASSEKDLATSNSNSQSAGSRFFIGASVVVIISLIAIVGYWITSQQFALDSLETTRVSYRTISTLNGQRTNIRLKDGTRITLNAASKLRIPSNYGKDNRTIHLTGEAFFDVEHSADHPFTVICDSTYIKDLGTRFDVSTYDSSSIQVAVSKGEVSVGRIEDGAPGAVLEKLRKNYVGLFFDDGKSTIHLHENISDYMGWSQGKLIFNQTSLAKIAKQLERWFDVSIHIKNSEISQRTLTASYDNMPFDEMLDVISLSLSVNYKRQNGVITFTDKSNPNQVPTGR